MDVENVEDLINYVFEPDHDFPDVPSKQEYKRLKRVMHIMVRFYEKGSKTKKMNLEIFKADAERMLTDERMMLEQLKSLEDFPAFHPRKQDYIDGIKDELKKLGDYKPLSEKRIVDTEKLYKWSLKIVESVHWLESQLGKYILELYPDAQVDKLEEKEITPETYRIYKRGLDEITYNLQESQDFFQASLDGRLQEFHKIHKKMIEVQLKALEKYPDDNDRKKIITEELKKDMDFVEHNMVANPNSMKHRAKMQDIHKDFFAVLKWQRAHLVKAGYGEPDKPGEEPKPVLFQPSAMGGCPVDHKSMPKSNGGCPVDHKAKPKAAGGCPVDHTAKAGESKDGLKIHRLYEKDAKVKPSLTFDD
mmetsp:Transcript_30275/g.33831  ORF Transcript_30275/g.33831 Transcript_30275/m.33831 type:complete len:361 (-) Transcript_30275:72-1154(-)